MIFSRLERIVTIIVAILMLCSSSAYLYVVEHIILPEHHLSWSDLTTMDRILVCSPTVFLHTYAILLLLFYKQRGVRVNVKGYQGSKYDWL